MKALRHCLGTGVVEIVLRAYSHWFFVLFCIRNRTGCNSADEILASYTGQELTRPNYCPVSGKITLINQAQVDNFATTYGACDTTPYGLTIEGSDITQVDALSALVTIKGDLKLYAPDLADLTGFANLETIEGALHVGSTSAGTSLVNVDALSKVTTLGGLVVYNNDLLEDLDGLSGVTRIVGDVCIGSNSYGNARLSQLDGLANVTSIGGDFYIEGNPALTDLNGFIGLSSVGGALVLRSNTAPRQL